MNNEKEYSDQDGPEKAKPEIMYVPLDVRTIENEDDAINVFEILRTLWDGRKTIFRTVAVFTIIGLLIALISVEEYTSTVRVLPETEPGLSLGALGGIAQQFGFSAAPQQSGEGISANLYPPIIQSNIFIQELMQYEVLVPSGNEKISLGKYVEEYQSVSILRYIIRVPFKLKKWITKFGEDKVTNLDRAIGNPEKVERLINMSNEEWETLRNIRERITTVLDSETGIVTINAKMQNPIIAASVADEVTQKLSIYITDQRTEKARRELEFIEERFDEAKSQFETVQQELAQFNDQNRGQLTAVARTEEQLLQSRYNLNFNIYNSMAERLEEARIKLQEETPVIDILDPAAIPDQRSEPNRILILILFIILGGIFGIGIVFVSPAMNRLKSEFKINK